MFEESLQQIFSMINEIENFKSLEIVSPDNLILNYSNGESKNFVSNKKDKASMQILDLLI